MDYERKITTKWIGTVIRKKLGLKCSQRSRISPHFMKPSLSAGYEQHWWGRAIFRVDDADAHHRELQVQGLMPELPQDAPWGERFFHVTDPDGHELSFAELTRVA